MVLYSICVETLLYHISIVVMYMVNMCYVCIFYNNQIYRIVDHHFSIDSNAVNFLFERFNGSF